MWGGDRAAQSWGARILVGEQAEPRNRGAPGTVAVGVEGWGPWDLGGGGLLRGQGAGEGNQVQAALRLPRRPAPTAVALGWVPVSGLKSAPPAQACPGTWQRGAGINTGKLEGLPELTRSLQLQAQGMRERFVLRSGCARTVGRQRNVSWGPGAWAREGWLPRWHLSFAMDSSLNPASIPFYAGWPCLTCVSLGFLVCKMEQ